MPQGTRRSKLPCSPRVGSAASLLRTGVSPSSGRMCARQERDRRRDRAQAVRSVDNKSVCIAPCGAASGWRGGVPAAVWDGPSRTGRSICEAISVSAEACLNNSQDFPACALSVEGARAARLTGGCSASVGKLGPTFRRCLFARRCLSALSAGILWLLANRAIIAWESPLRSEFSRRQWSILEQRTGKSFDCSRRTGLCWIAFGGGSYEAFPNDRFRHRRRADR